jgi:hypothetical protein
MVAMNSQITSVIRKLCSSYSKIISSAVLARKAGVACHWLSDHDLALIDGSIALIDRFIASEYQPRWRAIQGFLILLSRHRYRKI